MPSFPYRREEFRADIIQFHNDTRVVVALSGELDRATVPILKACLTNPELQGTADVEIDLAELTYIDSAGLAVLVEHWRDLNASGGSLVVFNPSRLALKVFEITNLTLLLVSAP